MPTVRAALNPVRDLKVLIIALVLCFAVAGLGLGPWYRGLSKPSWTPPGGIFAPAWTVLYALMAVAAWTVWRSRDRASIRLPLTLFGGQLALNLAWSGIFFGLRRPGLAFVEILFLWATILATLVVFSRVSRAAAALLAPYLAWVTFAAALNFALWRLNP